MTKKFNIIEPKQMAYWQKRIIIRDKKVAMIDGTAPHVVEPVYPGACEEIINFYTLLVGAAGFEPATLWSQTTLATNCATPRNLYTQLI